jgi:hypothetical protein
MIMSSHIVPVGGRDAPRRETSAMPGTRRDFLPSGVRLFLLVQGVATLVLVGVLIVFDEEIGLTTAGLIFVGMLVFEAGLQYMHSHITPFQDSIRIGFWPMFRRTFRYRDLAGVEAVTVDAMRDYRGWGVKGRSRS